MFLKKKTKKETDRQLLNCCLCYLLGGGFSANWNMKSAAISCWPIKPPLTIQKYTIHKIRDGLFYEWQQADVRQY